MQSCVWMQSCVGMQGDCSLLAVAAMRCATGAAEKPSDKPEQWHLLGAKVAIDGKQPFIETQHKQAILRHAWPDLHFLIVLFSHSYKQWIFILLSCFFFR